jgi:hypothetical protein
MKIYLIKTENVFKRRFFIKKILSFKMIGRTELTIGPLSSVLEESLVDQVCNMGWVANGN